MAMREECKHFQSRTYASGEVARFCVLDIAPEAAVDVPGQLPELRAAPRRRRLGPRLARRTARSRPSRRRAHRRTQELLDEAQQIVNDVAPDADRGAPRASSTSRRAATRRGWRFWRR